MRMLYMPVCLATLHILLNTGFIIENHIKPTPYTICTNHSPSTLATCMIFVKSASIFLQICHWDKISLTTSRPTIKSTFIHLLMVLLLSGQVELNPGPATPNQSSTFCTKIMILNCKKILMVLLDHPNRLPFMPL